MNSKKATNKYVAFLRGINIGGHHKVPMADLRKTMEELELENVVTLLNSGNVIFNATTDSPEKLEKMISRNLEKIFGFPVPTIVRRSKTIHRLHNDAPFQDVKITKDIRLYVSFLKKTVKTELALPWTNPDNSYTILENQNKTIISVLDISISKTPQTMGAMEKLYGSDITTRNWNTIERIVKKIK